MSLSLLSTTVLNRLRVHARALMPSARLEPLRETPRQQRKRLRQEVTARGGVVAVIETIYGNCPEQTAQQIDDLTRWLEEHRAPSNAA